MHLLRFVLAALPVAMLLSGCSLVENSHRQKEPMMTAYLHGDGKKIESELDSQLSSQGGNEEIMWRLEGGTYRFLQEKDAASFHNFERAQNLLDDYDRRAVVNLRQIGAEGSVLLTNPCALPYSGYCRDRVLFPVYKALACLGKRDEAGFRVELFNLRERQDKVIRDYQKYFQAEKQAMEAEKLKNQQAANSSSINTVLGNSKNADLNKALEATKNVANRGYGSFLNPFTIFMSGYGYLRDKDYQNALVDFERLYKAMPKHPLVRQYYATTLVLANRSIPEELNGCKTLDFPADRGNVLVIFANGRSAAFRQMSLYIPVYIPGYFTIASVAWPVCEYYAAPFKALSVKAGSQSMVTLPIADMDGILSQEYTDRLPGMLTRIILSTAVKEIASYAAAKAADSAQGGAGLAVSLGAAIYKAAMNTADTRSWEMLPKEYQIIQLAMPEERCVTLSLPGMRDRLVKFSPGCSSAIIYVSAPSNSERALVCRSFELQK